MGKFDDTGRGSLLQIRVTKSSRKWSTRLRELLLHQTAIFSSPLRTAGSVEAENRDGGNRKETGATVNTRYSTNQHTTAGRALSSLSRLSQGTQHDADPSTRSTFRARNKGEGYYK